MISSYMSSHVLWNIVLEYLRKALSSKPAYIVLIVTLLFVPCVKSAENKEPGSFRKFNELNKEEWTTKNFKFQTGEYKGRKAIYVEGKENQPTYALAYLKDIEFENGTIEMDIAAPQKGELFFGVAFRIQEETSGNKFQDNADQKYEYIYFRPFRSGTGNAIQYCAAGTKYNWSFLRKNFPGIYEGNAELPATDWFHVKIVVSGKKAEVFVDNAKKPQLVVKDLKHGLSKGSVGIYNYWKKAYFSNIKITAE